MVPQGAFGEGRGNPVDGWREVEHLGVEGTEQAGKSRMEGQRRWMQIG